MTCNQLSVVWLLTGTNIGYYNGEAWIDIYGGKDQIEVGEFGTFGVNSLNQLWYKLGTHEDPYGYGSNSANGWQL